MATEQPLSVAQLLKKQMETSIGQQLDQAVASGDAALARKLTADYAALQVATAPKPVAASTVPTIDQIRTEFTKLAPWFGIDPRKSQKVIELSRAMDPARFDTPKAAADALLKAYTDEEAAATAAAAGQGGADGDDDDAGDDDSAGAGDDDNGGGDDDNGGTQTRNNQNQRRRNRTQQPELNQGGRQENSNVRRAMDTGEIKFLPRAMADEVRASAERHAGKATKEVKAAFINNAVKAAARRALIMQGKYDPKENVHRS